RAPVKTWVRAPWKKQVREMEGGAKVVAKRLTPNTADPGSRLGGGVAGRVRVPPGETGVDATFGAGGHSELLAADLRGKGKLIAIDRDPSARAYFERFRKQTAVQGRFLRGEFSVVLEQLASNGVRADAVLVDVGVS